jgi:hypothetical protein
MLGGKVFFRFPHIFTAVVIENNNTFAVTLYNFLQSRLAVKACSR